MRILNVSLLAVALLGGSFQASHHAHAAEPSEGARRAQRVVPMTRGGKLAGLKVYALQEGSMFLRCGFENGDSMLAFDGVPITSPEVAKAAYEKIMAGGEVKVTVERRGVLLKEPIVLRK